MRNFWLIVSLAVLFSCATNLHTRQTISIGHEDLTRQKAVNVIVSYVNIEATISNAGDIVMGELGELDREGKIKLKNVKNYFGDGLEIADIYFDEVDYNWLIQIDDTVQPKVRYQNFSNDIDMSEEVHFRYCQERKIEFANIPGSVFSENYEYWQAEMYRAAVHAIYLLMKGNTSLEPVQVQNYFGRSVNGFKFGESDKYAYVLKGETRIYILPKEGLSS